MAKHLSQTYGDRAWSVCSIRRIDRHPLPVHGKRIDPLYPYIEAEVRYACRAEYAPRCPTLSLAVPAYRS